MLTEQQANAIKEQLLKQVDSFPEDKKEAVREKILSMSIEEVETFVKQNQLSQTDNLDSQDNQNKTECIFCNIASKQIPSFTLDEDKENLGVLEINPLSKGHSMIIPKKHLDTPQIPATTFKIAKKIANQIKKKYKPLEVKISAQKVMNHALIEIIPIYGTEKERKKASEEELKKLQEDLKIIKKPKREKKIKQIKQDNPITKLPKLKPRIP